MIEVVVLLLPIISIGIEVYRKIFRGEQSAIKHINIVNEYGVRGLLLRDPQKYLSFLAFIISPLYNISMGWAWMLLGVALLTSSILMILFSQVEVTMPEIGSKSFDEFKEKRRKKTIIGTLIVLVWAASWL